MTENTQLWLDLANQLMLAFVIVFVVGMIIGALLTWWIAARARRKAIRTWCESMKKDFLANPNHPAHREDVAGLGVVFDFHRNCGRSRR